MIDEKKARLLQLLGLMPLTTQSPYVLKRDQEVTSIEPMHSYWFARCHFIGDDGGPVCALSTIDIPGGIKSVTVFWLFVVKTQAHHHGHLLFPSIREPFDREFGGEQPFSPVDLEGWEDPMAAALKSADLFSFPKPTIRRSYWGYDLHFMTWNGYGYFFNDSTGSGKSDDKIRSALFSTARHFAKLYDDDELCTYLKHMLIIE